MNRSASEFGIGTEFGSQIEDVEAIDRYMRTTPLKTSEAFKIKDDYIRWFDKANLWDKTMSQEFYDAQRTRRNQMSIANEATEQDKTEIRAVIARGIDTEAMQGKKSAGVDAQTGRVGTEIKKPTVPATVSTMPKAGQPIGPVDFDPNKKYITVRQGMKGPEVKLWQSILGVVADGNFGPATAAATKKWQTEHKLTGDGVVGPATWGMAGTIVANSRASFAPEAVAVNFAPPSSPVPVFKPTANPAPVFKPPAVVNRTPVKPPVAFKPTASKPTAVASKPPAATSKPVAIAQKAKEKTKAVAVKTAGLFDIESWSPTAKVFAGITLVGSLVAAIVTKKPLSLRHH